MTEVSNREFAVKYSTQDNPQPLISVLLPLHAWHQHVPAAINSLLAQTHQTLEILVIGHDDIERHLDRLPQDKRLCGIRRNSPGIVGALNAGLQHATGEFIARMDSDDICHPERLSRQLTHLQNALATAAKNGSSTNPAHHILCGTGIEFIDNRGATLEVGAGNLRYQHWLNSIVTAPEAAFNVFVECPIPHPTWMAHRDLWQHLGGYRDCGWAEDYDFVLRAWLAGASLIKTPDILLQWRVHADRLTVTDERYSREAFIRAKAWAVVEAGLHFTSDPEGKRPVQRGVWICGVGRNGRCWFDALDSLGVEVHGFVDLDRPGRRQKKRDRPVIGYDELLAKHRSCLMVSALTQPEAREALVAECHSHGLQPLHDYVLGG